HYSRWSFDARNYFTYAGGEFDVFIDPNTGSISVNPVSSPGDPADARNRIGVFESNGETAYGFIPNPPFRSIYDLFKVIDYDVYSSIFGANHPSTFAFNGSELVLADDRTTITNRANLSVNAQDFSGPSVFRYEAYWDDD